MKVVLVNLAVNSSVKVGEREVTRVLTIRLESNDRYAIVTFINGKFTKCEHGGMNMILPKDYTYADWVHMGQLSYIIQDIQSEFEVTRSGILGAMDCSKIVTAIRDINPESFKVE